MSTIKHITLPEHKGILTAKYLQELDKLNCIANQAFLMRGQAIMVRAGMYLLFDSNNDLIEIEEKSKSKWIAREYNDKWVSKVYKNKTQLLEAIEDRSIYDSFS